MSASASNSIQNASLTFIRQDIQGLHAYAVQDASGMVKLDAMENPYTLSLELQAKLGARLGAVALNRYPAVRTEELRQAIKRYVDCPDSHDVMLGNGSDELISLLAMGIATPAKPAILAPLPGFVMYEMSAKLQGLPFVGVQLTADFELDVTAMLRAIEQHKPALTYIAYPNNPTANLWDDAAVIKRIIAKIKSYKGLVVMDEAYQPFSSNTWLDQIRAEPEANSHVLLMRTLSKFGLAGVRLGYLVAPTALHAEIEKLRPPYNISSLNAEAGLFALEHESVFAAQAALIRAERDRLIAALAQIEGLTPFKSQANMILVRTPDADKSFASLKAKGILVKNVSKMHPLLHNCLRLTVGTVQENDLLIQALQTNEQ